MDVVEQSLMERGKMLSVLKSNLVMAQNRVKIQADKHGSERAFCGDFVYLGLILYQLQYLNSHGYQKLHPKFYGPFEVLQRVGKVAYKLKLPESTNSIISFILVV